jgi:putative membrane protein
MSDHSRQPEPYLEFTAVAVIVGQLGRWFVLLAVYAAVVGTIVDYYNIELAHFGAELSLANTLILGLLLSFRNRNAFDRWWEARSLWGQLINASRNYSLVLRGLFNDDFLLENRLGLTISGFAESLMLHLRGKPRLQDITGFENDPANPEHLPLYLAGKLMTSISEWQQQGLIDGATALRLDSHVRVFLEVCGGCERIHNTPISRSYVFLLRFGIAVNVLFTPWYSMKELGMWGIPIVLLVDFFLLGVEMVDSEIEEPFGTNVDDLKLERYCETIRKSVGSVLPGQGKLD